MTFRQGFTAAVLCILPVWAGVIIYIIRTKG